MGKKELKTNELFFSKLSERKWNENDLSDVTWALCETNKKFKKLFLDFCFNIDTPEMEIFKRETQSHDSRPDFYGLDIEKKEWILEIKINDKKNLHFEQYRNEFPNAECAFIANYDATSLCNKNLKFSITTWKDFIEYLSKNVYDDPLIIGYIKYLKKLIGFLEVKNMNLNNVNSLPDFNVILEKVIHEFSEKKLEFNNYKNSFSEEKFGRYVDYKNKKGKIISFWIGIYFCNPENKYSCLCLEIKKENIKNHLKEGEYYYPPELDNEEAYFSVKDNSWDILFSKKPEIEKQKEIIYNFINEILENT